MLRVLLKQVFGGFDEDEKPRALAVTPDGYLKNKPILQQDLIDHAIDGYANRSFRFTFGKNSVVNNTRVDLWEGPTATYVPPTSAISMTIQSSSVQDKPGGTGVGTVSVDLLDANFDLSVVDVTLDGTNSVSLPGTILRVNYNHATSVGSNGAAVGDITITNVAKTVTYSVIKAGNNTARQAFGTVPRGYTAYISHWQISCGSATGTHFTQFQLRTTSIQGTRYPGVFLLVDEQGSLNGGTPITFPTPVMIPEMTDIKLSAISDAANANVIAMGAIMGWFEANP